MEGVFRKAKDNEVTHLSFVDHDTVAGNQEAIRLGEKYGINTIPGIEISAYDFKRNRKVHILGYNYGSDAEYIKALCEPLLERRHHYTLAQIENIKRAGYELDIEKMLESAKPSTTLYKQHVMEQLTDAAYSSADYQSLYKHLFKGEGVAAGDITYIDAFKAVKAVVADGGLAVVAHPGQLDSYDLIPELVEVGLGGIERNHPDHTASDFEKAELLAEEHNLIMTGGTDYHGDFGKPVAVGEWTSPANLLLS
jgi:hypothetical protein